MRKVLEERITPYKPKSSAAGENNISMRELLK